MIEILPKGHAVDVEIKPYVEYCDFRRGEFPPGTILDTRVKPFCPFMEWETEYVSVGGLCEDCGKTCATEAYFEMDIEKDDADPKEWTARLPYRSHEAHQ